MCIHIYIKRYIIINSFFLLYFKFTNSLTNANLTSIKTRKRCQHRRNYCPHCIHIYIHVINARVCICSSISLGNNLENETNKNKCEKCHQRSAGARCRPRCSPASACLCCRCAPVPASWKNSAMIPICRR